MIALDPRSERQSTKNVLKIKKCAHILDKSFLFATGLFHRVQRDHGRVNVRVIMYVRFMAVRPDASTGMISPALLLILIVIILIFIITILLLLIL
jgi:hypothetical protein